MQRVLDGAELSQDEIESSVREIAEGRATQSQTGAFLVALRQRGETIREMSTFASVLREYSVRIRPHVSSRLVDTCGTGGDKVKTFNVSTMAALVASGAGATVAKHGNRSVTSRCGSADVLERLGFNLDVSPKVVRETIETTGIGFMFAPTFHPAMKHVAAVRRELGVRTVFNLMGPLTNPAGVDAQVVGVYAPELVEKVANVLRMLGSEEVMVVHALEGMDEISVSGKTKVSWLRNEEVETREYAPEDFGIKRRPPVLDEVRDVEDGASVFLQVLQGGLKDSPLVETVTVNSAATLMVAGRADDFEEAEEQAKESLASGAALSKLKGLVKSSGGDLSRIEAYAASR